MKMQAEQWDKMYVIPVSLHHKCIKDSYKVIMKTTQLWNRQKTKLRHFTKEYKRSNDQWAQEKVLIIIIQQENKN